MLSVALSLLQYAPAAVKLIAGDKAGNVAEKIVNIAEKITGKKGNEAVEAIKENPQFALDFEKSIMDYEIELQRLAIEDRKSAREHDKATYSIMFVDAIRGLVRPIIALYFAWLISHCLIKGIELSIEQMGLLAAPVIYYFGERGFFKNKSTKDK
jgi:hypothetical protein